LLLARIFLCVLCALRFWIRQAPRVAWAVGMLEVRLPTDLPECSIYIEDEYNYIEVKLSIYTRTLKIDVYACRSIITVVQICTCTCMYYLKVSPR
jgi:hypothetical protein